MTNLGKDQPFYPRVSSIFPPSSTLNTGSWLVIEGSSKAIGENELLIGAQALALGHLIVTDKGAGFARGPRSSPREVAMQNLQQAMLERWRSIHRPLIPPARISKTRHKRREHPLDRRQEKSVSISD
jgi:hypothetical protein